MTLDAPVEERIQRLERSVRQLIQEIEQLPADVLYRPASPGEWPVMSTLAHLQELMRYWAHQAQAIAQTPGRPFGRTHDDPERIGAVEQHGRDSLDTIVARLRASLDDCLATLRSLPTAAWSAVGQHPGRGPMTVAQVVDAFLVNHAEEHAVQIKATLQALRAA